MRTPLLRPRRYRRQQRKQDFHQTTHAVSICVLCFNVITYLIKFKICCVIWFAKWIALQNVV